MHPQDEIAGVDGCRAGWIVATFDDVFVIPSLTVDQFDRVGIDMPIGLIDGPPRACDRAARQFLGSARSSVFPAPPRAALACTDYRSALEAARAATGRGISKQTFNIIRKVAEVDRLIDLENRDVFVEVHPECTFRMLNGDRSLPSKKTVEGQRIRRRLLADHLEIATIVPPGAALDDLLDAYAALLSISRFQRNEHRCFGDGQRDTRGIEMRIVC
jgi:predicted RNase H-like nuclease